MGRYEEVGGTRFWWWSFCSGVGVEYLVVDWMETGWLAGWLLCMK